LDTSGASEEELPQEDRNEGTDMDVEPLKTGGPDLGLAFLRWIRLLVCHITAIEILSLFFQHKPLNNTKVRIHTVSVRPSPILRISWIDILYRALQGDSQLYSQREIIVQFIRDHIQKAKEAGVRVGNYFAFNEDGTMEVSGVIHCESALAYLISHFKNAIPLGEERLKFDISMHQNLTVSKLCCPSCWALLKLADFDRFGIRGHHHKMFPVDLPPWMPNDHAESMVVTFQRCLREEVDTMLMADQPKGHMSTSFEQSVGTLSSVTSGGHTTGPSRDCLPDSDSFKLWSLSSNTLRNLKVGIFQKS